MKIRLKDLRELLTDHCALKYHLKEMSKTDQDTYRFCKQSTETAEHILYKCEILGRQTFQHLRQATLKSSATHQRHRHWTCFTEGSTV